MPGPDSARSASSTPRPARTPPSTLQLLARATTVGPHVGQLAATLHAEDPLRAVRRIQGLLALARRYGPAAVDRACAVALDFAGSSYQVVRRYRDLLQGRAPTEGDDDDVAS